MRLPRDADDALPSRRIRGLGRAKAFSMRRLRSCHRSRARPLAVVFRGRAWHASGTRPGSPLAIKALPTRQPAALQGLFVTGNHNLSSLIWGFADLLYNNFEAADHHKIILPLTLLRRVDCVLQTPLSPGR